MMRVACRQKSRNKKFGLKSLNYFEMGRFFMVCGVPERRDRHEVRFFHASAEYHSAIQQITNHYQSALRERAEEAEEV
jgi:hypothetical protein